MGKTSLLLSFYLRNIRKIFKKREIKLIPLGHPRALEEIRATKNKREMNLFLDALDEDDAAIVDAVARMKVLMDASIDFRRVIISCRTHFFARDSDIPKPGQVTFGPRKIGEPREENFLRWYLLPLDEAIAKKFIHRLYPKFFQKHLRDEAFEVWQQIPAIAARPMILQYVPEGLKLDSGKPETTFEWYEIMIQGWLKREINSHLLERFSSELAFFMWNDTLRGEQILKHQELSDFLQKFSFTDLPIFQARSRSLLNRNSEGDLKFAHRSIQEFLVVKTCKMTHQNLIHITDNMITFGIEIILKEMKEEIIDENTFIFANLIFSEYKPFTKIPFKEYFVNRVYVVKYPTDFLWITISEFNYQIFDILSNEKNVYDFFKRFNDSIKAIYINKENSQKILSHNNSTILFENLIYFSLGKNMKKVLEDLQKVKIVKNFSDEDIYFINAKFKYGIGRYIHNFCSFKYEYIGLKDKSVILFDFKPREGIKFIPKGIIGIFYGNILSKSLKNLVSKIDSKNHDEIEHLI